MAARYPSIPEPTLEPTSLRDSILSIKQVLEVLTGQRGNPKSAAVTVGDNVSSGGGGGGGSSSVLVSDTPPVGAPDKSLWWESDTGLLYFRYNDGSSTQWVIACPQPDTSMFVNKTGDTMTGPLVVPAPTLGGHAANKTYVDTADAGKVAKAGDTMTGQLNVTTMLRVNAATGQDATLMVDKLVSGRDMGIYSLNNSKNRWYLSLGNTAAESGANNGSDFVLYRYADDGSYLGSPFNVARSDGAFSFNSPVIGMYTTSLVLRADLPRPPFAAAQYISFEGGNTRFGLSFRPQGDNTTQIAFANAAGGTVGQITTTASTTTFVTTSDAGLKEDLQSFDAGNIIDNTEVYDFKWKNSDERAYGVLAQEAIGVYPTAVAHNQQDDNPESEFWGVDYSKYVPVLLQELKALRARVRQLEQPVSPKRDH